MLPSGTGREVKICVYAGADMHESLQEAGADILCDEGVLKDIGDGVINFDKLICTKEYL